MLVSNSILITTPARTCPGAQRPVPGVMFFNATTSLPDASTSGGGFSTLQLDGPLLLCATIFNATVPLGTRPALDLTNRTTPLWSASATGQVMVFYLVRPWQGGVTCAFLLCFATTQMLIPWPFNAVTQAILVPAWPLPNATSKASSALPLSALVSAATSTAVPTSDQRLGALIELTISTLVVPVLDFLALVTLATESDASAVASVRACMGAEVLTHAALLAPGIQVCVDFVMWARRQTECASKSQQRAVRLTSFRVSRTGHRPRQHHHVEQPGPGGLHGLGRQCQQARRAAPGASLRRPRTTVPLHTPCAGSQRAAASRCRCRQWRRRLLKRARGPHRGLHRGRRGAAGGAGGGCCGSAKEAAGALCCRQHVSLDEALNGQAWHLQNSGPRQQASGWCSSNTVDVRRGPPCGAVKERSSPSLQQAFGAGITNPVFASKPVSGVPASASALSGGPGSARNVHAVAQGSRLMALLRSQEQHLLAPGSGVETAAAGSGAAAAPGGLHQAHDLLMQSLVGTGPRAGGAKPDGSGLMSSGGSGASRPTEEHQRAVQQLATRLKGPGDGPDTVRWEVWSCASVCQGGGIACTTGLRPDCWLVAGGAGACAGTGRRRHRLQRCARWHGWADGCLLAILCVNSSPQPAADIDSFGLHHGGKRAQAPGAGCR